MGKAMEKVNPGRKRSRFTKEFKLEAVRLLELGEKPATQLALELGIRRNMLHKWQLQLRRKGTDEAFRGPGAKPLAEQSEIERLRRELKKVTEERDILKKPRRTSRRNCREVRVHQGAAQAVPGEHAVPVAGGLSQRISRMAASAGKQAVTK